MDTRSYRKKYAKREHGHNMAYPPGGADVIRLCDAVDQLLAIVRDIQMILPTEGQNDVERRLWRI